MSTVDKDHNEKKTSLKFETQKRNQFFLVSFIFFISSFIYWCRNIFSEAFKLKVLPQKGLRFFF